MALLESTTILKKYVTVSTSFVIEDLTPFKRQAIREFIFPFVGDLATELVDVVTGDDAVIKNAARDLLEEALAGFSLYIGAPELSLQITGTGFNVADTTDFKKATFAEKNDFQRNLLRRAHGAMDALLLHLEKNKDKFTSYTEEFQDLYNEFFVSSASQFQQHYFIHNSRQTYLALLPTMRRVEDEYLTSWLCKDLIDALKTEEPTDNRKEVKDNLAKALCLLTVSKVAVEGQFNLSARGIYLKFDVLPHEAIKLLDPSGFLLKTSKELNTAALAYLKRAKNTISENTSDFTECDDSPIKEVTPISVGTISKNKRILGL